jgi:hypothetical protein
LTYKLPLIGSAGYYVLTIFEVTVPPVNDDTNLGKALYSTVPLWESKVIVYLYPANYVTLSSKTVPVLSNLVATTVTR